MSSLHLKKNINYSVIKRKALWTSCFKSLAEMEETLTLIKFHNVQVKINQFMRMAKEHTMADYKYQNFGFHKFISDFIWINTFRGFA